ncbi:hypothetical protein CDL12_21901 [Handroanthus impetiginosus]|uniref:Uncharacterized protein n=1 Tax=Handroanthus impetiginosus TaxID=429701 RepID=A0A2G9GK21_9LAMI|nr:hypothetical protein CDL12_21901 [Handroanthus impetiginosus]
MPKCVASGIKNAINMGIAVQAKWEYWEFIPHISLNIPCLFDFLKEQLDTLERCRELQEVQINNATANLVLFLIDPLIL